LRDSDSTGGVLDYETWFVEPCLEDRLLALEVLDVLASGCGDYRLVPDDVAGDSDDELDEDMRNFRKTLQKRTQSVMKKGFSHTSAVFLGRLPFFANWVLPLPCTLVIASTTSSSSSSNGAVCLDSYSVAASTGKGTSTSGEL
jgi:hypothetical protein